MRHSVLLAWVFTGYTLLYTTGGPQPQLANPIVFTFETQSQCERQRARQAQAEDFQGRPAMQVSAACVEQ